ncbi:MAG: hypothetical protein K2X55_02580 [Burkholderiaceae bacterium]|nr:hypothetical protein [Burkholderiaceae bacterium]
MNALAMTAPPPQPALPLYPLNLVRLGKAALAVFGALSASLLISLLFSAKSDSSFGLNGMLLLAFALQLLAVVLQGQALGRGVSVLQIQRAPATLWRAWLRQWLLSVTRYWAALSLAVAVLLATPASHQHWLAAPALLALLLCACVTAAMARAGLLPRRLGMALEAALLLVLLVIAAAGQVIAPLDYFSTLPLLILAPCALAWPAMAYWIMRSQADALRSVTGSQTNLLRHLRDAVVGWAGRYQTLRTYASSPIEHPVNRRTLLVIAIMQNFLFFRHLVPVQWGEQVSATRMAQMALICLICCNTLLVRDLHWRTLLLPRGTQLRRLGTRILLSSMMFQAPVVLLIMLVSMATSPALTLGWHTVGAVAIPLLELACCTALMAMLRALPNALQTGALACLCVAMVYGFIPPLLKLDVPQLTWQIGPAYALLLATITGTAVLIGNRLWTPARLLNALTIGLGK